MDEAGDGISKLGFIVTNAMAAYDRAICFHHFRKAAGENAFQNIEIAFFGETNQRQCSQRASTHGVNIAQSVGSSNLAESVGIVDDRRKEINSLHQRGSGSDLIHPGIVGVVEADKNVGVMLPG